VPVPGTGVRITRITLVPLPGENGAALSVVLSTEDRGAVRIAQIMLAALAGEGAALSVRAGLRATERRPDRPVKLNAARRQTALC
jgi:hypothetical protein